MAQVTTPAGVTLEYETVGDPDAVPLLMVCGYNTQLISWDPELLAMLADGGRYVITYDNRDCGLSQKWEGVPARELEVPLATNAGDFALARALAAYTLDDLAGDAAGLLTALGIDRAHVLGTSMGGMIAQQLAILSPARVLSLTSIMSRSGEPGYGDSSPESLQALIEPTPADREGNIAAAECALLWRSKRYPNVEALRADAAASFDRSYYPAGALRHLIAMVASGSRADGLRALHVPTLVIHGRDDTLIEPSGGIRTAELVPDAELMLVDDMGHDLPPQLWPQIVEAILRHTAR